MMQTEKALQEAIDAGLTAAGAIAPAAFGSAIAVMMKGGLRWTERAMQLAVGILVSWYATLAITAMCELNRFVVQAIAFTIGYLALDALPLFKERTLALLGDVLDAIRDRIRNRKAGE
jgi:uncharacterized membrane protein (DUF441 family)